MRSVLLTVALVLVAFFAVGAVAAGQSAPTVPAVAAGGPAGSGPVPVPVADQKTMDYYWSGQLHYVGKYLMTVLIAVIVLFTGLSARMRAFAQRVGRFWIPMVVIYVILFVIADFVLGFPFAYLGHLRERSFGLTQDSTWEWFLGALKALGPGIIFISVLAIIVYGLMRFSPRRWWLYIALAIFVIQVSEPWRQLWFSSKGRLAAVQDQTLAAGIDTLTSRAKVHGAKVYQTGKGPEMKNGVSVVALWTGKPQIVVADPAASKFNRDELLFITARGLGALRLQHNIKYNLILALLSVFSFYLLYRVGNALIARYKDRFGFDSFSDVASWPLFPALFNVFFLIVQPLDAASLRHFQREADRFALELVQNNRACAESFIALSSDKLINPRPGPVHTLWRAFDPPLAERIEFCNTYRPWEKGEPLKYGAMFDKTQSTQLMLPK